MPNSITLLRPMQDDFTHQGAGGAQSLYNFIGNISANGSEKTHARHPPYKLYNYIFTLHYKLYIVT